MPSGVRCIRLAILLVVAATTAACTGSLSMPNDGVGDGDPATGRDGAAPASDGGGLPRDGGVAIVGGAAPGDGAAAGRDAGGTFDAGHFDGGPPASLPALTGVSVDCSAFTVSDLHRTKEIYEETFGPRRPQTEADFGWTRDASLLTPDRVRDLGTFALPTGKSVDEYHELLDFNPMRFERNATRRNDEIFAAFDPEVETEAPYRRYNPLDYLPYSATHYGTGDFSDIMATQFVFRIGCYQAEMEEVFARCPDCIDTFVALSRHDMYKIFDVRFVREQGGELEVSRPFRMFSVDASGHIPYHATSNGDFRLRFTQTRFPPANEFLRAFRRFEISGPMAQILGTYGGPTPLLVRTSTVNDYPTP